jgi:invasion protein IalB
MISRLTLATAALTASLALSLTAGGAVAQTAAAPAGAAMPMTPMAKRVEKPRTAQSLECSKKADAQNVHGKPRKTFMSKCKAGKA